jgi:16S rRNA (adenine1518-N6/adenine1519-N6)-dimethyltransferase
VLSRASRPPLGQHFLRDTRFAHQAIAAAGLKATDAALEVGPGQGVLTKLLAPHVARLVCIEIDPALAEGIDRLAIPNVTLVRGDAVQCEWPAFDACVSNLPYQISSPFLFRLLARPFRVAVLLLQKEFADRLVAKVDTGEYGRLSVNAQRRADVEILARVPPGAFDPPPRVDSALVRIVPRAPSFEIRDEARYDLVVEAAFAQRRKKLANALAGLARGREVPHGGKRAGELTPAEFAEVAEKLR